jgi:hypothetical protein
MMADGCPMIRLRSLLLISVICVRWSAGAFAADNRPWQVGKIIRAEQPQRAKPEIEVWNPSLTHWYAIESDSVIIKATETVPEGVKRRGTSADLDRDPRMAFRVHDVVKFALGEQPPDPKAPRELFVLDRKGREHTLTVDEIAPKGKN